MMPESFGDRMSRVARNMDKRARKLGAQMEKTLEERTNEAIASLELGYVDQATRGEIIDVLREWEAREEALREAQTPAT
jgi:hypothetical protein